MEKAASVVPVSEAASVEIVSVPPQSVVIEVPDEDEEMEDSEEGVVMTELKWIWANATGSFQEFVPTSFADCAIGRKSYKEPPAVDRTGDSDDEEWLREKNTDLSLNKCYGPWIEYLRDCDTGYYSCDALWAAADHRARDNPWCPFQNCEHRDGTSENPKAYKTRNHFLRHLVMEHCHHHPEYCCTANVRGVGTDCKGLTTERRGDLVRHLNGIHHMPMPEAVSL